MEHHSCPTSSWTDLNRIVSAEQESVELAHLNLRRGAGPGLHLLANLSCNENEMQRPQRPPISLNPRTTDHSMRPRDH